MSKLGENKVLMIGIDAGEIGFIQASLDKLPCLRGLFEGRPPVRLRSTADLMTASVWPTFSTGTLPGEHGTYFPLQWDPPQMQFRRLTADWLPYEPFWVGLAGQGARVVVLDVPFAFSSLLERGVEVRNWGSHERIGRYESNRPDLLREINRRFGRHPMGLDIPVDESSTQLERMRRELVAGVRRKADLTRWLLETTEWDFFLTVFGECHRGGHILWPKFGNGPGNVPADALLKVYQAVDEAIGHVLEGVDPSTTTVILFSVHGMGPNLTQDHFVRQVLDRINAAFRGEETVADSVAVKQGGMMRVLREAVPAQVQLAVAKAVPIEVRDWVVGRSFTGGVDWSRTPGFALPAGGESFIRFNLVGREAKGMLVKDSEQRQRYEKWVKENFLALKAGGTNAPLVRDVVSVADRYSGPRSDFLPDLVILWNDLEPATEINSDRLGRFVGRLGTGRTGNHRPDGFAVLAGNPRPTEHAPPLKHIADFAPFVRSLLTQTSPV